MTVDRLRNAGERRRRIPNGSPGNPPLRRVTANYDVTEGQNRKLAYASDLAKAHLSGHRHRHPGRLRSLNRLTRSAILRSCLATFLGIRAARIFSFSFAHVRMWLRVAFRNHTVVIVIVSRAEPTSSYRYKSMTQ